MVLILTLIGCLVVMASVLRDRKHVLSKRRKTILWVGVVFDVILIAGAVTAWIII
jgi:hypothetical protein